MRRGVEIWDSGLLLLIPDYRQTFGGLLGQKYTFWFIKKYYYKEKN